MFYETWKTFSIKTCGLFSFTLKFILRFNSLIQGFLPCHSFPISNSTESYLGTGSVLLDFSVSILLNDNFGYGLFQYGMILFWFINTVLLM